MSIFKVFCSPVCQLKVDKLLFDNLKWWNYNQTILEFWIIVWILFAQDDWHLLENIRPIWNVSHIFWINFWIDNWLMAIFPRVVELNLVKCHQRFGCLPWGKRPTPAWRGRKQRFLNKRWWWCEWDSNLPIISIIYFSYSPRRNFMAPHRNTCATRSRQLLTFWVAATYDLRHVDCFMCSAYEHVMDHEPFSVAGPTVWNGLPQTIRNISSVVTFKKQLKTHYVQFDIQCMSEIVKLRHFFKWVLTVKGLCSIL